MTAQSLHNITELHPKPTASFVTVTPDTARNWLSLNTKNRNLRKADLDRYKRDMLAGNWRLAGDPIRFGTNGALLDGQHRLTAIVETGVTLPLLVIRGVQPEAQAVMDTGRRRTAADALAIDGKGNATLLAATALLKISYDLGKLDSKHEASHEEILQCVEDNPGLVYAAEFANNVARRTDCPPSIVAFTFFTLAQLDLQQAEFWVAAADKVGLAAGDPVIALTNRFAEARRNRERLTKRMYLSAIFRAWNYRRAGRLLRMLKINSPAGGLIPLPEPS